jgi:hypothetical protein
MGRALAKPIALLNHVMGIAALHPSYGLLRPAFTGQQVVTINFSL